MIFACLALLATYAVQTWRARTADISSANREATNLARSLSQEASDTFKLADVVLLQLRADAESAPVDTAGLRRRLQMLAMARVDGFPIVYALAVVDRFGRATAGTQASGHRVIDFSDREYFKFHSTHATRAIHIGPPIRSKIDGHWIITATRRIDLRDGTFGGLVEMKMSVDFFHHIYSEVDIGKDGLIVLIRDDGIILVRKPDVGSFSGKSVATGLVYRRLKYAPSGNITGRSITDGIVRLNAYRRVDGYPLVTIVAFSERQLLSEWQSEAIANFAMISCVIAIVAFLGMYLANQIQQRKTAQDQLGRLASVDGLTGLANRRQFDAMLDRSWRRGLRDGTPLTLLMLDADHFKSYNDRYGHLAGDDTLKTIARCISEGIQRPDDLAARYGGEEFAVILPATQPSGAFQTAERIRCAVAAALPPQLDDASTGVTLSIGVASMLPRMADGQGGLIAAADRALYDAKHYGRNRTVVNESGTPGVRAIRSA